MARLSDKTKNKEKAHDIITIWLKNELLAGKLISFEEGFQIEMEHRPQGKRVYYDLSVYRTKKASPFEGGREIEYADYCMNFEIKTGPSYSEALRQIKFYDSLNKDTWCVCAPYDEIWINLQDIGIWYVPYDPNNLLAKKVYAPKNRNKTKTELMPISII